MSIASIKDFSLFLSHRGSVWLIQMLPYLWRWEIIDKSLAPFKFLHFLSQLSYVFLVEWFIALLISHVKIKIKYRVNNYLWTTEVDLSGCVEALAIKMLRLFSFNTFCVLFKWRWMIYSMNFGIDPTCK